MAESRVGKIERMNAVIWFGMNVGRYAGLPRLNPFPSGAWRG